MKETPLKNFHLLVSRLLHAMEVVGYLPSSPPSSLPSSTSPPPLKPLLLFGHSFGAMLVTHLAQALRERREDEGKSVDVPLVLVSGMAPLDVGPPSILLTSSSPLPPHRLCLCLASFSIDSFASYTYRLSPPFPPVSFSLS